MKDNGKVLTRHLSIVLFTVILSGCAGKVMVQPEPVVMGSPYVEREDALGVLLNQAFHAIEAGELDEAGGWLSRAMRIKPTEPVIYYHMAEIHKELGDTDQARQLVDRALSLDPDSGLSDKLQSLLQSLES